GHRLDREAVALVAAVAAPLAHPLVDEHACRRLPLCTSAPLPAGFGRALLVVDEDGDAGDVAQDAVGLVEAVAGPHLDAGGPSGALRVLAGVVGAHDHAAGAFRQHVAHDLWDGPPTGRRLPTGHGHRRAVGARDRAV